MMEELEKGVWSSPSVSGVAALLERFWPCIEGKE